MLATELIDQGRLLAAHTLLARRIVTVERYSWVRTRSRAFFLGDTFDEQWIQNNIEVPSHETPTPTPPNHVGIHSPDPIRNALADYLDE